MRNRPIIILLLLGLVQPLRAQVYLADSLDFVRPTANSPEELLAGRVSGLWVSGTDGNPASALLSAIRGMGSLRGDSSPLWIIDGVILTDTEAQRIDSFFRDEYAPYQHTSRLNGLSFLNLYDIERIEVLKDVSATALYGSKGANGVILITTRSAGRKPLDVQWNSNLGVELSSGGLAPAFSHNHQLAAHFQSSRASYSLSAFWRDKNHPVPGADDKKGGIRLKFDTKSNPYIWFGFNTAISVGKQSSAMADAQSWWQDHDDINNAFRTTFDAYLRINFFPFLYWNTSAGMDAKNDSRNHWEGLGNPFGAMMNRAGAFAVSSALRYNLTSSLVYDGHLGKNNRLRAEAAVALNGDKNRFEINAGDHFLTDALRGNGMAFRESVTHPYWLKYNLFEFGAYGSLKYSFKEYFKISALLRADNCARYDDGEYSLFPSAAGQLDLHRMLFPKSRAVSVFTLEGGYGLAGMRRYVPYLALDRFIPMQMVEEAFAKKGIVVDVNVPQDDRSSFFDGYARTTTGEWHIGFDLAFLSGRLGLSGRWYDRKSDDRFTLYGFGKPDPLSAYAWKKAPRETICEDDRELSNKGLELELAATAIQKNNIEWSFSGNFSYNDWNGAALPDVYPLPRFLAGIGTRFCYAGFTAELWGRGAWGNEWSRMDLSSAALSYNFPMKSVKFIQSLAVSLTAANLYTTVRTSLPTAATVMAGVTLRF